MQFAKYLSIVAAVAVPVLTAPTLNQRAVEHVTISGRSYLIVHFTEEGEEEASTLERRGISGDQLIAEDGTTYVLVPVTK